MAAFRACACKLSWTLLFARPGSAPIWGGKKGELRDWNSTVANSRVLIFNHGLVKKCSSGIGRVTTTTAKKPKLMKFLDQQIIGTVCYLQAGLH